MTDSLGDLLKQKKHAEPPEFQAIKAYVTKELGADVAVSLQNNQLVITAANAALAGTLRMHIVALQQLAKTDQRLIIRIG